MMGAFYHIKNKREGLIFLLIVFALSKSFSQNSFEHTAPTLQVGLDGLSFSKGVLDKELIMEIIGEKQREIKLKAVQSLLLGKMEGAGGTLYSYADNVIRGIVEEKDQEIRTRRILENTVNVAFVFAFADYYIRSLKIGSPEYNRFNSLFQKYVEVTTTSIIPNEGLLGIKRTKALTEQHWYSRKNISGIGEKDLSTGLIALCLDMVSEIVRSNKKLKDLGLFQISYSATYDYLNIYRDLISYDPKLCPAGAADCPCEASQTECINSRDKFIAAKPIYDDIQVKLDQLTDYVGLVYYLVEEFKFRNNRTDFFSSSQALPVKSQSDLVSEMNGVSKELERIIKVIALRPNDSSLSKDVSDLVEIDNYLLKAKRFLERGATGTRNINGPVLSDIIYTIRAEFLPLIRKVAHRDGDLLEVNKTLLSLVEAIANDIIQNGNSGLSSNEIDEFFKLIGSLYQFGKAETFSEYLKVTNDLADAFLDEDLKEALSTVVSFVKDYTVIKLNEKGKEVVDFNVESFLVKLQNIKPNANKRFQFLFTVGVNSIYFNNKLIHGEDTISNFSFVSEKIGVKFKFIDRAFWQTRNPGETYRINRTWWSKDTPPKEPIVSNYHLLVYGSGLLYNIANVGTSKSFNAPILGAGAGITFTNTLDLNLTIGIPLLASKSFSESRKCWFVGLGFDIQFGEYLNRLSQKRQVTKTQKLLTAAKTNP